MYSAYKLNKQGDNIQPWHTPFPILNQFIVPCPVLTVASFPAYRFLRRQVRWSGIPISLRILQFVVIYIVEVFSIVSEAEADVFWKPLAFSMILHVLAIWSLVPLPFLNPAWTSGSFQFTYCLSLTWCILGKILQWVQLYSNLNSLWHCFSLGFKWKLTFSSPVVTAEFSKFAGITSATL